MAVSVSKISSFNSCHYKYKLQYIDKVPQEIPECFSRGSRIHKALEHLEDTDSPEALKFSESPLGVKYRDVILTGSKEHRIGLKVSDGKVVPCEFSDKDCFFHGIIDVLSEGFLLDYKTGKAKRFSEQDWTQLMFYSVWYFLMYPERDSVVLSYLYVEHSAENSVTMKRSFLEPVISKLLNKVLEIRDYENNPTDEHRTTVLCDYCTVRKNCKFYSETLENTEFQLTGLDGLLSK